jgi:dsDNA-specific endonuclease/ATPase MutS2
MKKFRSENQPPFSEPFEVEITDVFDLHSFEPHDVKAAVNAYLDEARRRSFSVVRIIHGKGIGVQREIVRNVLRSSAHVKKFSDAKDFSSWGATIVWLD